MLMGAEIKVFPAHCDERHRLSANVRSAIQNVYARSAKFEHAKRTGQGLVDAVRLLQSARDECLSAERAHDAHVREHGCMERPKTAAATA